MTKFFKKDPKNPILEPFWALFVHIWAKMNFRGKKSSFSFQIFQLSNIEQKIRKK